MMDWAGILASLRPVSGVEHELIAWARGLRMGLRIEATGHEYIRVITGVPSHAIASLLASLRIGVLSMGPIALARPFNYRITLGESRISGGIIHEVGDALEKTIPNLVEGLHSVRLRVRGHGIGVGDAMREDTLGILERLGVRVRRSSSLILSLEALRASSGSIRVYIGLYPREYLIYYGSVRRTSQEPIIPRAESFTWVY